MKFRVLTYNVHKCVGGLDRRYRPERIARVIGHYAPDLVLLQEVTRGSPRLKRDAQVDLLGDLLGLRHRTWFANHKMPLGGEYGNAILSRFPLTTSDNIDLTVPPRKRRSVLHGRCRVRLAPGRTRTLHVFNLHLGLSGSERVIQLQRFLESHPFAGLHQATPIVVAGDFNDVWGTLGRRLLVPRGFSGLAAPIRTFPAYAPVRALDSIFMRGSLRLLHAHPSRLKLAGQASDHLPIVADLAITH